MRRALTYLTGKRGLLGDHPGGEEGVKGGEGDIDSSLGLPRRSRSGNVGNFGSVLSPYLQAFPGIGKLIWERDGGKRL